MLPGVLFALLLISCRGSTLDPPDLEENLAVIMGCFADSSGQTDMTDPLNSCIARVPTGGTLLLAENGRYRAEGVIRLMDKRNITIEGNGALIFATTDGSGVTPPEDLKHLWPRARSHVEISQSTGITIRNLAVRGANPYAGSDAGAFAVELEGQHGFDVRGVHDLLLENVTVTDTYGDLIYLGPSGGWSTNITIRGAHLERSGRQGIALTGVEDALIENSYIGEVGRTIIDIEPFNETGGARRVTFSNNTFGYSRHLWVSSGGKGPNVSDVVFQDNQLIGMAIQVRVAASDASVNKRRGRHAFYRNVSDTVSGGPLAAFRFSRVDGVEVIGNVAPLQDSRSKPGVYACESTNITVEKNSFPGSAASLETSNICPAEAEQE